jgi:hypothetical protein
MHFTQQLGRATHEPIAVLNTGDARGPHVSWVVDAIDKVGAKGRGLRSSKLGTGLWSMAALGVKGAAARTQQATHSPRNLALLTRLALT